MIKETQANEDLKNIYIDAVNKELGLPETNRFKEITKGEPIKPRKPNFTTKTNTMLNIIQSGRYRNNPCPCGSGKKVKNCCGRKI